MCSMIFYDFKCYKCNIIWEKDYPSISKTPRRKIRCPKCNRWAERHYSTVGLPGVKIPGSNHKVRETDVKKLYTAAIEDSRQRLTKEQQMKYSPYKSYKPNIPQMVKDGVAKPCSPKRLTEKFEAAKRLTAHAYEKAGVDLKKSPRRTNDD